jgi:hypothetical protein
MPCSSSFFTTAQPRPWASLEEGVHYASLRSRLQESGDMTNLVMSPSA